MEGPTQKTTIMGVQWEPFIKSFLSPGLAWGKFWASRLWRERESNSHAHCTTGTRHFFPQPARTQVQEQPQRGVSAST